MPRSIRYHLDENCNRAVADGLRRRGIDVTTTPEVGLLRASDEDQAAYGLAQGRVNLQHDEDFLEIDATGPRHAGIVFCRNGRYRFGEIVQKLVLIWEIYDHEELSDRVEYL